MDTEEQLTHHKRSFYAALLENDLLARIILEAMDAAGSPRSLTDFTAEPWHPERSDAPAQILGLMYRRSSVSCASALGELNLRPGTFEHIDVLSYSRERSDATLLIGGDDELFFDGSEALMALTGTTREELKGAAKHFMDHWQTFREAARALDAHIDPHMGTFTTDLRNYQIVE